MSEMTAMRTVDRGILDAPPPEEHGYAGRMDDEIHERHLNIHFTPEIMAGVYANFANVSHSDYEFTITFARVDHEVDDDEVPGVVVSRVNLSPRFMRELIDAMQDNYSKWSARERIRELPETENRDDDERRGRRSRDAHRRRRPPARPAGGGGRRLRAPARRGRCGSRCSRCARSRSSTARRTRCRSASGRRVEPHLEGWPLVCLDRGGGRSTRRASRRCCATREERPPQRTAFLLGGADGHRAGAAGRAPAGSRSAR